MMKSSMFFIIFLITILISLSQTKECKKDVQKEEECNETEYQSYVECVRKRMKRRVQSCEESEEGDDCNDCDCGECEREGCEQRCSRCCHTETRCATLQCCHRECHSRCRTTSCRRSCRADCRTKTDRSREKVRSEEVHRIESAYRHNITTIINLKNLINNTNHIDIPIKLNNTNYNNITIKTQPILHGGSIGGGGVATSEKCCHLISPRQCVPQPTYPFARCFHMRHRKCGNICTAPIIHEQPHEICDVGTHGSTNCHQQVVYIPQPQPRCSYTSVWPYVQCGIQSSSTSCEGCYSKPTQGQCSSACYDYGFDVGPYYRQGPFYQQGLQQYHPCMQTGTCGNGFGMGMPYPQMPYPGSPIPGLGYPPEIYENNYMVETDLKKNMSTSDPSQSYVEEPIPMMGMGVGMPGMVSGMPGSMAGGMPGGIPNVMTSSMGGGIGDGMVGNMKGGRPEMPFYPPVYPPMSPYNPNPMISVHTSNNGLGYRSQAEIKIESTDETTTQGVDADQIDDTTKE